MADSDGPKSWWQTLPGIITGVTAAITAIAGLVVAVQQTGWFGPKAPATMASSPGATAPPPASVASSSAPPVPASVTSTTPPAPAAATVSPGAAPTSAGADRTYTVTLPALRDHQLGLHTYTLLKIERSARTGEDDALTFRVRMMNNDRYDQNFWDSSFRLIVDGVPRAPEGGLNELVKSQSAKDGDVVFVIPRATTAAKLRILAFERSTEVPLDLKPPR